MKEGLLLEEFGGEVQAAEVSAIEGIGIDDLLDKIAIQVSLITLSTFCILHSLSVFPSFSLQPIIGGRDGTSWSFGSTI
jgi:hypothetical protein